MALEWAALGTVTALEAMLLMLITMPGLTGLRRQVIELSKASLQPLLAVVPFSFFLMLEIYWQFENIPECSGSCNVPEQDRMAKSVMKNQRNMILVAASLLLYWLLFRVTAILVRVEASNVQIIKLNNSTTPIMLSRLVFNW